MKLSDLGMVAATVLALLLCGSGKSAPGPRKIMLTGDGTETLRVGDVAILIRSYASGTGYRWEIQKLDGDAVTRDPKAEREEQAERAPKEGRKEKAPGSPVTAIFAFRAVKAGKSELRMAFRGPGNEEPEKLNVTLIVEAEEPAKP